MLARKPVVPWLAYGSSLPDLTVGRRPLIAIGLRIPNRRLSERYFDALYQKGLIRLKTQAEIIADESDTMANGF